jgi:hypothetical protein
MVTGYWGILSAIIAGCLAAAICAFALIIALRIVTGKIDLSFLIAEPADPEAQKEFRDEQRKAREAGKPPVPPEVPKASLARFQFLIFTFVIAGVYLVLCLESGRFVEIPQNVILLLGVSGTSYAASKGIHAAATTSQKHAEADIAASNATTATAAAAAVVSQNNAT